MTVAALHAERGNKGGWLLMIEGCEFGFTNIGALAGGGASSWIGTTYGARSIKLGLQMPTEVSLGETDPWGGALVQSSPVTFGLLDLDGTVLELFKDHEVDDTTDSVGQRISPLEDPVAEFTAGPNQTPIGTWDRNIGVERFGPAGQRRWFWLAPSDTPPGLDHFGGVDWPPALLTDTPTVWAGRKVALYRIVYDPSTGTWPSWGDQYAGGGMWWYGTMKDRGGWRDGDDGRVLSIACLGPVSWLRKSGNLSRPTRWYSPQTGVTLTGERAKIAAWIETYPYQKFGGDGVAGVWTVDYAQTLVSGNTVAGLTTRAEVVERVDQIAQTMIDNTDHGGVLASTNAAWTGVDPIAGVNWGAGDDARRVVISADGSTISIQCETPTDPNTGRAYIFSLCMDAAIWESWGWDINQLSKTDKALVGGVYWGENAGDETAGPYHYTGSFSTRDGPDQPSLEWDNGGELKTYTAPYQSGVTTLSDEGGQDIRLGVGVVPCEGQHGQPFTFGAQIDGTDVDACGWWIFRGERLTAAAYEAGEDPVLDVQVAFCEWIATSSRDAVEIDSLGYARIRIVRWEDPRRFGLPFDRLTESWASVNGGLECAPIAVLGGIAQVGPGWRHRLIPSVLHSSGTSTWDDSGGVVEITTGDNHPSGLPPGDIWFGDVEAADLGLGLPAVFVDWASWKLASEALPGGVSGALNRVTYALFGSAKLEPVLNQAMAGAGLAWSLKRQGTGVVPSFGAWDPLGVLTLEDAEATLERADMAEAGITDDPLWRGTIELRAGGPYDRFEYSVDRSPLEQGLQYEVAQESQDHGRRYRDGTLVWPIVDGGLRDPTPWLGTELEPLYTWGELARQRFAAGYGPRHARQVRVYRATYNPSFAGTIGLGSVVHVIDSTAESPDGTRGINHLGRVTEAAIVSRGELNTALRVAVELQPRAVDQIKVWAPEARAGVGSWDSSTSTLTVLEDHADVGGGHEDTAGFVQPAWDTHASGALRVAIYQSETGRDFPAGYYVRADVSSVDAVAHTITLTSISGTIYRDMIKIIVAAPKDEQTAAWALALYVPITEPSGLWDGVEKGDRL